MYRWIYYTPFAQLRQQTENQTATCKRKDNML